MSVPQAAGQAPGEHAPPPGIRLQLDGDLDPALVAALMDSITWARGRTPEALMKALSHSEHVASAWDGDRLVGVARSIGDGVYYVTIWDVIVHPDYQGRGIGDALMAAILGSYRGQGYKYVALFSAEGKEGFYRRLGFEVHPRGMKLSE